VDNLILPPPERAHKQMPRGIGQLPEATLRNTSHIGDDDLAATSVRLAAVEVMLVRPFWPIDRTTGPHGKSGQKTFCRRCRPVLALFELLARENMER
jgi:hypothetical protein